MYTARNGISVLELLVIVAVAGVIFGVSMIGFRGLENPLGSGSSQLEAIMKQARARAISTTSAYRVRPGAVVNGVHTVVVERAPLCSAGAWTGASGFVDTSLPKSVAIDTVGWEVCFTARGSSTANTVVTLSYGTQNREVEVYLAGGVEVR